MRPRRNNRPKPTRIIIHLALPLRPNDFHLRDANKTASKKQHLKPKKSPCTRKTSKFIISDREAFTQKYANEKHPGENKATPASTFFVVKLPDNRNRFAAVRARFYLLLCILYALFGMCVS